MAEWRFALALVYTLRPGNVPYNGYRSAPRIGDQEAGYGVLVVDVNQSFASLWHAKHHELSLAEVTAYVPDEVTIDAFGSRRSMP